MHPSIYIYLWFPPSISSLCWWYLMKIKQPTVSYIVLPDPTIGFPVMEPRHPDPGQILSRCGNRTRTSRVSATHFTPARCFLLSLIFKCQRNKRVIITKTPSLRLKHWMNYKYDFDVGGGRETFLSFANFPF